MKRNKILVTGGAGFIGSNLVDRLIDEGHDVVVIDNLSTGKREYINSKAKFFEADVCDAEKMQEIFEKEKFDYVFHLAAQIDVIKSVEDPMFDNKVNAVGSYNIFKASADTKVKKVIFVSTGGAIYGSVDGPATEDTLIKPMSPYAIHKFAAEKYLEMFHNIHGLDYTVLRLANIYGPRQYRGGECGVITIFLHNFLNGKQSVVYGDGKQTRDYVYVGDVINACLGAMKGGYNGTLNIGLGKEVSVLDIISDIEKATGEKFDYDFAPERPGEVLRSVLDARKAKEILNWKPEFSLEEGIKKTIAWTKEPTNF